MSDGRVAQRISAGALGDDGAGTQRLEKTPALQDHLLRRVGIMDVVGPRDGRGTVGKAIDGMGSYIARRLPKAYEAAARREALDRALKRVLADRVEDHLEPVTP